MRSIVAVFALIITSCAADGPDNSHEWRHVLSRKKAAQAPQATTGQRQMYADSLAAFVDRHPGHSRAREVYTHIQLDFARELASLGRYRDAIRFYRAVLAHDSRNADALQGIAVAVDRLSVSRDKLLALQKGMSPRQVAHLLGKPIPGWTIRTDRRDCVIDSWFYRNNDGTIAGVHFRDGELFAADANSDAKLVPFNHAVN